jgi:WD40 repeat protein
MEAAIRWSPHSTQANPRFLIIDVAGNRLRLCQIDNITKSKVSYKQICIRDKLPNYTAFDWSRKDAGIVGIGSASGEAVLVTLDPEKPDTELFHAFPIRHQRKCNSIAFSTKNLLATGLDRVRNDVCLNIYDLNDSRFTNKDEPYKKLASSEAISSIKFFSGQPDTLVAGVSRQCLRIYDLRGSSLEVETSVASTHTSRLNYYWYCSVSDSASAQYRHRPHGRELFSFSWYYR